MSGGGLTRRELLSFVVPSRFDRGADEPDLVEVPGRFRLDSLRELPDSVLLRMVPVIRQGWSAEARDGGVACKDEKGDLRFVRLDPDGCAAASRFDGVSTLEEIARRLERDLELPPGYGITSVREAFLRLAESEAYHPIGPPEPPRPDGSSG